MSEFPFFPYEHNLFTHFYFILTGKIQRVGTQRRRYLAKEPVEISIGIKKQIGSQFSFKNKNKTWRKTWKINNKNISQCIKVLYKILPYKKEKKGCFTILSKLATHKIHLIIYRLSDKIILSALRVCSHAHISTYCSNPGLGLIQAFYIHYYTHHKCVLHRIIQQKKTENVHTKWCTNSCVSVPNTPSKPHVFHSRFTSR